MIAAILLDVYRQPYYSICGGQLISSNKLKGRIGHHDHSNDGHYDDHEVDLLEHDIHHYHNSFDHEEEALADTDDSYGFAVEVVEHVAKVTEFRNV